MTNHKYMMEAIQLLQHHKIKSKRLPLWHYVLDYSLTLIFLSLYGAVVYWIISSIL